MKLTPFILRFAPLLLVVAAFAGASATTLRADDIGTPEATLRHAVDDVLAAVFPGEDAESATPANDRVRAILERYFDFPSITRRALGPVWRQFTDDERRRVSDAFSALAMRTYTSRFESSARPVISYEAPIPLAPERCEIPTRIVYAGATYRVSYRLERSPEGWRIYDIVVEGVSFIANYRAQFDAIAQRGGPAAVLQALETRSGRPEPR